MSEISSLSLKIPSELKEKIKAAALENEVSISAEVSARLLRSFDIEGHAHDADEAEIVDSQNTEEIVEQPLTAKEIKKLRQLLKGKGTSRKK
ncbi:MULTISPECIES: Arc family DNA-binding protein [Dickeya]|uniref:Arc family DNA-binding protein n=1 Tax=Dickeya TaxID=204037 RepID=UPI001CE5AA5E|nr:Arc family DNA-binding protein [Dickeya zeae]